MERERAICEEPVVYAHEDRTADEPCVFIVDDDPTVREAITELILSAGLQAVAFASTGELLDAKVRDRAGCLILDVRMPGLSGLDLQTQLAASGDCKPVIFLTGYGDIPMTVQAMKCGAVDFLTKPAREQALLDAVSRAMSLDTARRAEAAALHRHIDRIRTLTRREREVLREVARGRLNKQIAFDLGISEVTVKLHRGNAMRKLELPSLASLIRMWETLPPDLREPAPRQAH